MCGLAGELRFSEAPSCADWGRIADLMGRRGPDGAGEWSSDPRCTMVFRRLSILDLSARADQPMMTLDRRFALVYNGEVYNYRELRHELEGMGTIFRSSGDTEVVLQALRHWGVEALRRFNGMFALAFYDCVSRRLLLARDHAGIKPLYFMLAGDGVVFASQYDQLLAHPWSRGLGISEEGLALYLRFAHIPAPYALLRGTRMVRPGEWVEVRDDGGVNGGRYFEFPRYRVPSLCGGEAVEAMDACLRAAVRRQLVSDVPVGTFLSGGVDSPLVTAKAVIEKPGLKAFTLSTDDDSDESEDAGRYARELQIDHTVVPFRSSDAAGMVQDVVASCGEPLGDFSMFPTMLLARTARRHCKVMLAGDGGDDLLWGYPARSAQILQRLSASGDRAGADNLPYPSVGAWHRAKHTHLPESLLCSIFPDLTPSPPDFDGFRFSGREPGRAAQWLRWSEMTAHLPMVLLKVDRASMYCSLEVRVPFLDLEVVDTACRIDWRSCFDIGSATGKLVLRRCLEEHLGTVRRDKRGFAVPMGRWLRTSLRAMFEDVIDRGEILGLALDRPALREAYGQHLSGARDLAWGLWPILNLALWERHHFAGR